MNVARKLVKLMNEASDKPLKDIIADLEIPVVQAISSARKEANEKVIQDLRDIQAKIHDIYNELGMEAPEIPPEDDSQSTSTESPTA